MSYIAKYLFYLYNLIPEEFVIDMNVNWVKSAVNWAIAVSVSMSNWVYYN